MTPKELEALFTPLLGDYGWQKKLAETSGFTQQTISNYMNNQRKITKTTAMYLRLIAHCYKKKITIPNEHTKI